MLAADFFMTARAVLLFVLFAAAGASERAGADELPAGKLVIDIAPPSSGPAWFAAALEEMIARELSRFHSVQLVEKLDSQSCTARNSRCLVELYRGIGTQVVVLGQLHK